MTRLEWDVVGQRKFETGVDHGVLYLPDGFGVYDIGHAWNGLTSVTESPSGAEASPQYADNIKYLNLISIEEFGATIEAFTYPDEFAECDGTAAAEPGLYVGQQPRKMFGLSYRTRYGNDIEGTEYGYKLHMVYGAIATPSEKAYATINDSPEAIAFSWEVTTTPIPMTGFKPTASLVADSTVLDPEAMATLEDFLYGTEGSDPSLPLPDAIRALFSGSITEVTPTVPTYNSSTDLITIPSVTGVIYKINGVVVPAGTVAITQNTIVKAVPANGYRFPSVFVPAWLITYA